MPMVVVELWGHPVRAVRAMEGPAQGCSWCLEGLNECRGHHVVEWDVGLHACGGTGHERSNL